MTSFYSVDHCGRDYLKTNLLYIQLTRNFTKFIKKHGAQNEQE